MEQDLIAQQRIADEKTRTLDQVREECAHKADINDGMRHDLKEKERESKGIDGELHRCQVESQKLKENITVKEQASNVQEQDIRHLEDQLSSQKVRAEALQKNLDARFHEEKQLDGEIRERQGAIQDLKAINANNESALNNATMALTTEKRNED